MLLVGAEVTPIRSGPDKGHFESSWIDATDKIRNFSKLYVNVIIDKYGNIVRFVDCKEEEYVAGKIKITSLEVWWNGKERTGDLKQSSNVQISYCGS